MKTIDFAYKTVNISRIGYLSTEIGTGFHGGDWYKTRVEADARIEQLQRKIGIIRC